MRKGEGLPRGTDEYIVGALTSVGSDIGGTSSIFQHLLIKCLLVTRLGRANLDPGPTLPSRRFFFGHDLPVHEPRFLPIVDQLPVFVHLQDCPNVGVLAFPLIELAVGIKKLFERMDAPLYADLNGYWQYRSEGERVKDRIGGCFLGSRCRVVGLTEAR